MVYYLPDPEETELDERRSKKKMKVSQLQGAHTDFINDLHEFRDEIAELKKLFTPEVIRKHLMPRLQQVVNDSENRFVNFLIWDEFMETKNDPNVTDSRNMSFEDQPIYLGNV